MDKIIIKNLEVFANHGVFPEETALGQKFIVSAELLTDTRKAGKTVRAGGLNPLRPCQCRDYKIYEGAYL